MSTALVILADGFEEIEAVAPIDILRRAGVKVTIATLADNFHATGRNGITMHGDTTLAKEGKTVTDLLLLPGGNGVKLLRADPRVSAAVMAHDRAGKWIAAICAAPTLLNDCGLLMGRRYTAHFSVAAELPDICADEQVVTHGNITTSRGACAAIPFGLHLVSLLLSPPAAAEISNSICCRAAGM